jgi:hypothetical protein
VRATNALQLSEIAPSLPVVTSYDRAHINIYVELLQANELGVDWRETSRTILGVDPRIYFDRARSIPDLVSVPKHAVCTLGLSPRLTKNSEAQYRRFAKDPSPQNSGSVR